MPSILAGRSDTATVGEETCPRIFPCEQCGADLKFTIGVQSLQCPFCGYVKELALDDDAKIEEQDFHAMLARVVKQRRKDKPATAPDLNEVNCNACNAVVQFTGNLTSTECAYCGAPLQKSDVHQAEERIAVDAVLPFLVDRRTAEENLRDWVTSRWFAPNEFTKRGVEGKFNGVYLPYWTFDSATTTHYTGMRGEYQDVVVSYGKSKRASRKIRWFPASGSFQRFLDDVLVVASTGLPLKRILKLEPWPLHKCIPYTKQVLAGFFARTYDVELDQGFNIAKDRMEDALRDEVKRRIGGDTQRITTMNVLHNAITFKHILLPLWMMAYRYQGKVYQVVVNAGTGEVQGDRPYSWIKVTLAVVAGAMAAFGFYYLSRST